MTIRVPVTLLALGTLALAPLGGCDHGVDAPLDDPAAGSSGFEVSPASEVATPAGATSAADPVLVDEGVRVPAELGQLTQAGQTSGWFTFELLNTTCEQGSDEVWQSSWYGDVWIAEGEIDMNLPMFPLLSGDLDDRETFVTGVVTWMDTQGFDVLCDVEGSASVDRDGVDGEVTETLSSVGPTNCETTVAFHFEPDALLP